MSEYAFNPLTGNLDRVGDGGGGGGNITIGTDSGTPIVGDSFFLVGREYKDNVPVVSTENDSGDTYFESRAWATPYVVDPLNTAGERGTFTTIQAAVTQAVANGDATANKFVTIIIRNQAGLSYVESVNFPAGRFHILGNYEGMIRGPQPNYIVGFQTIASGSTVVFENIGLYNETNPCFSNSGTLSLINSFIAGVGNNAGSGFFSAYNTTLQGITFTGGTVECYDCDLSSGSNGFLQDTQFIFRKCAGSNSASKISLNGTAQGQIVNCTGMYIDGTTSGQIYIDDSSFFQPIDLPNAAISYNTVRQSPQATFDEFFTTPFTNLFKKGMESGNTWKRRPSNIAVDTAGTYDQYVGLVYNGVAQITLSQTNCLEQQYWFFMDERGDASTNTKTIIAGSPATINGAPNLVINQDYGWALVTWTGTEFLAMTGTAGGGGGSITITPESGGGVVGMSFNLDGGKAGTVDVMTTANVGGNLVMFNNTWETQYVVDPSVTAGLQGTFTTIQAAMDQAVADGATLTTPKLIIIRPADYTENLVIPAGIYLRGDCLLEQPGALPVSPRILGSHTVNATNLFRSEGIWWYNTDATADLFTNGAVNIFNFVNCILSVGSSSGKLFTLDFNYQHFTNCIFYGNQGVDLMEFNGGGSVIFDNCSWPTQGNILLAAFARFYNCNTVGEIICDNGQMIAKDSMFFGTTNCISGTGAGSQFTNCQFNSTGPAYIHAGQPTFTNCSVAVGGNSGLYEPGSLLAQGSPTNIGNIQITQRVDANTTTLIGVNIYEVDCSGGAITVTLPSTFPADICWTIKDATGDAATNNITIQVQAASGTIDEAATYVINQNFGSVTVKASTDGVNYLNLSNYGSGGGGGGSVTLNLDNSTSVSGSVLDLVGASAYISGGSPFKQMLLLEQGGDAKVADLTFLTPYVVDAETEYGLAGTFTTIQDAIDAAIANGAILANGSIRTIFIRPGAYVEDPSIPAGCLLNFVGMSRAGAATGNTSDVLINGQVSVVSGSLVYFENICFYNQTGADSVVATDASGCFFTNCSLVDGSNSALNVVGGTNNIRLSGCYVLGKIVSAGQITTQSGQAGQVMDCLILSTCVFEDYSEWDFINSQVPSVTINDHAVCNLINCSSFKGGSGTLLQGTSVEGCTVSNWTGRTAGTSSSPPPMFDFPGTVFLGNMSNKLIDGTYPIGSLTDGTCTIKMMPTMKGSITTAETATANYLCNSWDEVVWLNHTTPITVTLSDLFCDNQEIVLKDMSLDASTNNVTVSVAGGGLIEGNSSFVINIDGQSVKLKKNGANYFII